MSTVVLLLSCGHWTKGQQVAIGVVIRCEQCHRHAIGTPDRRASVIGHCSPHQLSAIAAPWPAS